MKTDRTADGTPPRPGIPAAKNRVDRDRHQRRMEEPARDAIDEILDEWWGEHGNS